MEDPMSDDIVMTRRQLRRLLSRFQSELDTRGGKISDADLEQVATRLVDEINPSCVVTGSEPERMLNSNVTIKG
jgi:hypothetical protein